MKKITLKSVLVFVFAVILSVSFTIAQEKPDSTKQKKHDHSKCDHKKSECCKEEGKTHKHSKLPKMMNEHKGHDHSKMMQDKKEDIVRKGAIDLKAIDKNKDGKVYQDQMCWNVISDKPGRCPLCEMKLKEVTLDEAERNLVKNKFDVKK